jgi:predicted nucleic acid-binding Zn ribbon protein
VKPRDELPVSLRESLGELTAELRVPGPDAMRVVQDQWPDLVGSDLAPHVRLGSLRDGTLTLEVDDPSWATPLRYLESSIVETLAKQLGRDVVRAVRIVVRKPRELP